MDQELISRLERIAAAGIRLLPTPQVLTHFVFERDGYVVLVERRGESFGSLGSPGKLLPAGFAALVQRSGRTLFVAKGAETEAGPGEAESARRLFTDLKRALR